MPIPAISVEGLWKQYRLGAVGSRTLFREVQSWMARLRGVQDPNKIIQGLNPLTGYYEGVGRSKQMADRATFFALKDVNFVVEKGEILGVIGKNGAGKSTLLKILSRVTGPTRGVINMNGRVSSLLEVGTGFHHELTGRENIFLNGAILGMTKGEIAGKLNAIIDFAEVERFIDTPVKRYSSGMYMRLAFSVAAHLDPDIFIVDEVLAVGDYAFQQKCLTRMDEVSNEGKTVLVVSHNMASVTNLCKRGILLEKGELIYDGPIRETIKQYVTRATEESGCVSWKIDEAPGDETLRLISVKVLQGSPELETKSEVEISREIVIELNYWNFLPGHLVYSAIHLLDSLGSPLFSSSNLPSVSLTPDPYAYQPHAVGLFTSRVKIPANFLNNLTYGISAVIGRHPLRNIVWEVNVLNFHVIETGEMSKDETNPFCGTIRPKLAWHTVATSVSLDSLGGETVAATMTGG